MGDGYGDESRDNITGKEQQICLRYVRVESSRIEGGDMYECRTNQRTNEKKKLIKN